MDVTLTETLHVADAVASYAQLADLEHLQLSDTVTVALAAFGDDAGVIDIVGTYIPVIDIVGIYVPVRELDFVGTY